MDKSLFQLHRGRFFERMADRSVAILFSGEAPHKSADQFFPYETNRNFFYLTGIERPSMNLVIIKDQTRRFEYLFIEETSDYINKWFGRRMSADEAAETAGIDRANVKLLAEFPDFIANVFSNTRRAICQKPVHLYLDLFRPKALTEPVALVKADFIVSSYPELVIKDANEILDVLRVVKDAAEITAIETAIGHSRAAIEAVLKHARPGMNERELAGLYEFSLRQHGAKDMSFHPILASGANAAVLHYEDNDKDIQSGALVLMDLGSLDGPYASDISRTFPIDGKFTARQKQLYSLVLAVNKKTIEFVRPGLMMAELQAYARNLLAEGMVKLGLIANVEAVGKHYYHNVSHYLGLDVHDVGSYLEPLRPGVVLTIEPGIYIEEEGLGIRIEDNVLVTESGRRNLSQAIIKEIADIENFMAK